MVGGTEANHEGMRITLDSFCCYVYRTLVVSDEMVDADRMKHNFVYC